MRSLRNHEYLFSLFYFGVGHFNFIQGYITYKKVCFQIGSEIKSSTLSQISFVNGQRMVFTSCQACLHGGGGPQVSEVTRLGGVTHLSI